MPRGITKRRPITITALLDAAMELFAEQGYGATSVPDICARAGLTKGAFYSNFANKDALFLALLDRSWERRAEWIRRAMPAGDVLAAGEPGERAPLADLEVDRQWTLVSMEFSLHAIRQPEVASTPRRARAARAVGARSARDRGAGASGTPPDTSRG